MQAALDFVANAPGGRPSSAPVWKVQAGMEPPNFTACFQGWDHNKAAKAGGDVFQKALAAAKASGGEKKLNSPQAVSSSDIGWLDWKTNHFTAAQLASGGTLPDKVDPAKREMYLSDSDFEKIFKMKKDAWLNGTPDWKRKKAKQDAKLF